jgi:hypothetical protein
MNGRNLSPTPYPYEKNNYYTSYRYVKPSYIVNEDQNRVKNIYYDNNPYYMNNEPLNKVRGIYNTTKNVNKSKDLSDTSSQRSGKVTRAHGLKIV